MGLHFRWKAPNWAFKGFKVCWIQKIGRQVEKLTECFFFRRLFMPYTFLYQIFTFRGLPRMPGQIHVYISTNLGNNVTETQVDISMHAFTYTYTRNVIGRSWVRVPHWVSYFPTKFRFGVLFMTHTHSYIYMYIFTNFSGSVLDVRSCLYAY